MRELQKLGERRSGAEELSLQRPTHFPPDLVGALCQPLPVAKPAQVTLSLAEGLGSGGEMRGRAMTVTAELHQPTLPLLFPFQMDTALLSGGPESPAAVGVSQGRACWPWVSTTMMSRGHWFPPGAASRILI